MGLDIFHYRTQDPTASALPDTREFHAAGSALEKFLAFATKKTNQYLDWPATFEKVGLPVEHYEHGTWGSTREGMYHGFFRKPIAPAHLPEKLKFHYGRTPDDLGDLVIVGREDTVIFGTEAGYQRKRVYQEFFQAFKSREYITDRDRVEKIFQMTLPEHQPAFRQAFIDNWDDERSFVVVSY